MYLQAIDQCTNSKIDPRRQPHFSISVSRKFCEIATSAQDSEPRVLQSREANSSAVTFHSAAERYNREQVSLHTPASLTLTTARS